MRNLSCKTNLRILYDTFKNKHFSFIVYHFQTYIVLNPAVGLFQSNSTTLLDAPWYVRNKITHSCARITTIENGIEKLPSNYFNKLYAHQNESISRLYAPPDVPKN